jgi:hydrogenase 3 maturation protease
MLNSCWSKPLAQRLTRLTRSNNQGGTGSPPRFVILGIGNEFNGDDAAGVAVVRRLQAALAANTNVLVLDGGTAPENFTGPIRRFSPRLVVLVDCADIGAYPGSIAWLEMDELEGFSASTHTLPPTVLAHFLSDEIGCEVGLIGIQPESINFGARLSEPVALAVKAIVDQLLSIFSPKIDTSTA